MEKLLQKAKDLFPFSQSMRRDLHRHPEIGYHETRTAGIVARELTDLGLEVATGIAQTGVVGLLEGKKPGPVILARFDMDALPVQEETGAEYASANPGVMHACGHDGHVAIGLTVARLLAGMREKISGTVKFVFQPAEEGLGGAQKMMDEGVLKDPRPDYALALHLWNERPVGWVAVVPGPLMAGGDFFSVKFIGKGGHGALPHTAIDPIVAAAQWVTAAQSIVARNVSPLQAGVVSITYMHGGEAFNVIPPSVELRGTIRTFEPEVRQVVISRFEQQLQGMKEVTGCEVEYRISDATPPVMNDPRVTARIMPVIQALDPELRIDTTYRTMVSEDMSFMLQEIPGCYLMVGSANPEKGLKWGHHHPRFDFDEAALPIGASVMAAAILEMEK